MSKKLSDPYAYGRKPKFTHEHKKYAHGHLCYICSLLSFALFVFCIVQGILVHTMSVGGWGVPHAVSVALLLYIIAAVFLYTAMHYWHKGRRHYPY